VYCVIVDAIVGFPATPSPFVTEIPVPAVIVLAAIVSAAVLVIKPFVAKLCKANACPVNDIVPELVIEPPVNPVPVATEVTVPTLHDLFADKSNAVPFIVIVLVKGTYVVDAVDDNK